MGNFRLLSFLLCHVCKQRKEGSAIMMEDTLLLNAWVTFFFRDMSWRTFFFYAEDEYRRTTKSPEFSSAPFCCIVTFTSTKICVECAYSFLSFFVWFLILNPTIILYIIVSVVTLSSKFIDVHLITQNHLKSSQNHFLAKICPTGHFSSTHCDILAPRVECLGREEWAPVGIRLLLLIKCPCLLGNIVPVVL